MAKLIIPTPLRKFTENQSALESNGSTVIEAMQDLANEYPNLKKHIFDDHGKIRNFIRIYLGNDDIQSLQNENTPVADDSVISIIPAIAGGTNN
ncbi:MoaD/ThiS family protein [Fulvivirgaceae bacterium BMA10]|uniref:MoaD/ThiS family protein n=1 Tax=Splendidivirga corallicola TaxID=3051826 RepID=A0ABT8KZI4_9BACT|nr:MoaD/ThiS family protein [Fulvivirgaceae bacterium BMA10]